MCFCCLLSLQSWIEFAGYRLSDVHREKTHTHTHGQTLICTYAHTSLCFKKKNLTKPDSSICVSRLSGSPAIVPPVLPVHLIVCVCAFVEFDMNGWITVCHCYRSPFVTTVLCLR